MGGHLYGSHPPAARRAVLGCTRDFRALLKASLLSASRIPCSPFAPSCLHRLGQGPPGITIPSSPASPGSSYFSEHKVEVRTIF